MSRIVTEFYAAKASKDADRFVKACDAAKAAGYVISVGGFLSETAKVKPEPAPAPKASPIKLKSKGDE